MVTESWLPLVQAKLREAGRCKSRLDYRGQPFHLHTSQSFLASPFATRSTRHQVLGDRQNLAEHRDEALSRHDESSAYFLFCRPILIIISVYMTRLAGMASHNHPYSLIHLPPSFFSRHFLFLSISLTHLANDSETE